QLPNGSTIMVPDTSGVAGEYGENLAGLLPLLLGGAEGLHKLKGLDAPMLPHESDVTSQSMPGSQMRSMADLGANRPMRNGVPIVGDDSMSPAAIDQQRIYGRNQPVQG